MSKRTFFFWSERCAWVEYINHVAGIKSLGLTNKDDSAEISHSALSIQCSGECLLQGIFSKIVHLFPEMV